MADEPMTLEQALAKLPRLQQEIEQPVDPYGGDWRGLEISVADFCDAGSSGAPGIVVDRDTGRQLLRLIAAAGTAAHEAREMGYDPVEAVRALPELLKRLEEIAEDSDDHCAEGFDLHDMAALGSYARQALDRAAGKESDQ